MNPDRHSPPPGSSAYYLIRFAPRVHRPALGALYEIVHAIHAVHREIDDPGVAGTKLAWWRDEIGQAAQGTARHPAVQRLHAELKQIGHPCWQALQNCVAAAEANAQQSRYLDETALLRQVESIANSSAQAIASILVPTPNAASATLGAAAITAVLVQSIRRLGQDARRGVLYVPINDLQQFDVKAHEILQIKSGLQQEARYQNLMRHQAQRAHRHLEAARADLKNQPRALRRFNAILLAHNSELLDALEAARFEVLHQHIGLTPLRKLWLGLVAR